MYYVKYCYLVQLILKYIKDIDFIYKILNITKIFIINILEIQNVTFQIGITCIMHN